MPPPTKKRRIDGAEASRKRRRGKERELCQLNLDVLFLLAEYLEPLDLLNLARTCKSLRELLMDKASAFIWKTARRQVRDLPDCPDDLAEPEYANLVFYARCNNCGKRANKVLWMLRRRYCTACRVTQLHHLDSCPVFIRRIIPYESFALERRKTVINWVDGQQKLSLLEEYHRSPDKKQFYSGKQEQHGVIWRHAVKCRIWAESKHKSDLELLLKERNESIFERLNQHGYAPEIGYFGRDEIRGTHESFFNASKPLTEKEWSRMLPCLLRTMNDFRSERIEETVYHPRRSALCIEYDSYVSSPSPDAPTFGLLPHVIELRSFPPFQDIIKSPEETEMGPNPFESAFAQLPVFVDEWRKQLDAELAELIEIPSRLSSTSVPTPQAPTDKLRLACAVFDASHVVACYPDVFSAMFQYEDAIGNPWGWERDKPIQNRFCIKFVEDAPYIVYACGLDPNVATADDMDRRNARLKCLSCNDSYIRCWRGSLHHAVYGHGWRNASLSTSVRWQIVDDMYVDAIQTTERSATEDFSRQSRCLLCRPCVGDAWLEGNIPHHFAERHGMEKNNVKRGVHYKLVDMDRSCTVEMVQKEGQVTFKVGTFVGL